MPADQRSDDPSKQAAARMGERLAATLESITDAFYTLDREWRFTYLNREAEKLFKRPRAQLLGKVLWDEFGELKGQIGYCEFHRAMRENRTVVFEEYYAPYQALSEVRAYPSDEGLTVYFRDVTAQRQYAARLRAVSFQLLNVQEAERARIAAELHDEMGQTMTALKLGLQSMRGAARSAGWEAKLDDNIQLAAGVLDRIRDLSLDLRPPLLGEIGLAGALDAHVKNLADISGLDIRLEAGQLQRLPHQIEIACFRVAQEALTNAIRHAEASRISVRLFLEQGTLQLRVGDDGVGFDPDAAYRRSLAGKSMGLLNMVERVKLIGGSCFIRSAPGQGTSVEASFPPDDAAGEPFNPAAPSRPAPN